MMRWVVLAAVLTAPLPALAWGGPPPRPPSPSVLARAPIFVDAGAPETALYGASGATWLTGHPGDVAAVKRVVDAARRAKAVPVFVQYGIPGRDKKGPSHGGAGSLAAYYKQVEANAAAVGGAEAIVIIEPDALALGLDPFTVKGAVTRYHQACPRAKLFIDAGHAMWKNPDEMVPLLGQAGIDMAEGFSLNVSAYQWTFDNLKFGIRTLETLASYDPALGAKRFVIDTSRNGSGPGADQDGQPTWGDPVRAMTGKPITNGPLPTWNTDEPVCEAYLWVKAPGYGDNRTRPATQFGGAAWVTPNVHPSLWEPMP